MDRFASSETAHCPLWFSLSPLSPIGLDALIQEWPKTSLYAFPQVWLLQAVLLRVRVDRVRCLLLLAPFWPSQVWFSDLIILFEGPPWEIPLRPDLLSQAQGKIWHPHLDLWDLFVWPLNRAY